MKNYFILLFLLSTIMAFQSCGDGAAVKQAEEQKSSYEHVMAGHDEVMPLTGQISRVSRDMKKYLKNTPELEEETKTQIRKTVSKMLHAEEKMFEWMANFQTLEELQKNKSHEEIMSYLKEEDKIMEEVKVMTNESLSEGRELWKTLQPQ